MLRVTAGFVARLDRQCLTTTVAKSLNLPCNFCRVELRHQNFLITRFFSTSSQKFATPSSSKPEWKPIYQGPLARQLKLVKLFSLSTSCMGLALQPMLLNQLVAYSGVMKVFFMGFCGLFIFLTPMLLHLLCKRYIIRLRWDGENHFVATRYSFFCAEQDVEFRPDDVTIPTVDGVLTSFNVKGAPLFADPNYFTDLSAYEKMLGYDKPMDFKFGGRPEKTE